MDTGSNTSPLAATPAAPSSLDSNTSPNPAAPAPAQQPPETLPEQLEKSIVAFFIDKIHSLLEPEPITLHNLQKNPDFPNYRAIFLRFLREGKITIKDEDTFLTTLPASIDTLGERAIFDQIAHNTKEKQLLAVFTGLTEDNWQDVVAANVGKLLAAPRHAKDPDYRTPIGFSDLRRRFLTEIRAMATPAQLDSYVAAMNSLESHLYGDRFTYYRQFEHMRKEAQALGENIDLSLEAATDPTRVAEASAKVAQPEVAIEENLDNTLDPSAAVSTASTLDSLAAISGSVAPSLPTSRLTPLGDEHRAQLLAHATIEGDPWRQGGKDYTLTTSALVTAGLIPKYELGLGDRTVYLTSLFTLPDGQLAALAYVPNVNSVKVRAYYRDKNFGLWRYLPDYIRDISGEGIASLGVGFDEHSTILPIELQAGLAEIERLRSLLDLSSTNPNFLFAGTAPSYATRQEFRDAYSKGTLRGDFYHEVSSTPYNADARVIAAGTKKTAPQLISVSEQSAPNFNQMIAHFSTYAGFPGQLMGEGFWSVNKETKWLFFSDYRGRSWVANIDTTSPTTSTGCKKEWLLPTDIATPLYESSFLADGYGDSKDVRAGSYFSMWNNYLSKIPLIQQYSQLLASREHPTAQ